MARIASVLILSFFVATKSKAFLGAKEFKQELQSVLDDVLGRGHGVNDAQLAKIQATLTPMFNALPKNHQGHLSASVMRYVVQRYFSQQHGWVVRGFEPHAQKVNASQAEEGDHILQSKLPDYIRASLEETFAHNGFAVEDTAMMVAAVERLAFDEVINGLELSYKLNLRPTTMSLNHQLLMDTLSSYLIVEMLEGSVDGPEMHASDKENVKEIYPNWDEAYLFLQDVVQNDAFLRTGERNPFVASGVYSFEDAARIAQRISEDFGPQSNHECNAIKDSLVEMDIHGTGRVKLSDFYGKSQGGQWEFRESADYLRSLGALDESSKVNGPQVIIPNYITGMANCVTSSAYYSVCCASECDHVYQHLEQALNKPTSSVSEIIRVVEGIPSGSNITSEIRAQLEEVAKVHGGNIPIHGRLFAQWIHYAFPQECPYPHQAGTVNPETPLRYEDAAGEDKSLATDFEIEQFLKAEAARVPPSREAGKGMWNLHERVLESSTPSDKQAESWLHSLSQRISQIALLGGFVVLLKNMMPQLQHIQVPKGKKAVEYDV